MKNSIKPNLFIIGAPKCGTTALAHYLSIHKDVHISDPKEPLYYMHPDSGLSKFNSEKHYLNIFSNSNKNPKYIGDASVWYLYSSYALQEISNKYPKAKIIIMIRDRIEFIESLHSQLVFGGYEKEDLKTSWLNNRNRYFYNSNLSTLELESNWRLMYSELSDFKKYISKWQERFGLQNVYIVEQRDFKKNPNETFEKVVDFLDISKEYEINFETINANKVVTNHFYHSIMVRINNMKFLYKFVLLLKNIFNIKSFGIYSFFRKRSFTYGNRDKMADSLRIKMERFYNGE